MTTINKQYQDADGNWITKVDYGGDINVFLYSNDQPTEEQIDAALSFSGGTADWQWEDKDTQSVYIYYGYSKTSEWQIRRKTIATSVYTTAEGTGDYATAWSDRENKIYT
jgi:hypothetical protein